MFDYRGRGELDAAIFEANWLVEQEVEPGEGGAATALEDPETQEEEREEVFPAEGALGLLGDGRRRMDEDEEGEDEETNLEEDEGFDEDEELDGEYEDDEYYEDEDDFDDELAEEEKED